MNQNNATTFASNLLQWAAEEQLFDFEVERVPLIAGEISEGLAARNLDVGEVDWRAVEEAMTRFLAAQAPVITQQLRKRVK